MKKTLIICSLVVAILCTSCANSKSVAADDSSSKQAVSSKAVSSAPVSSEVSSAVSSETPSSAQVSSAPSSSETVASAPPSSVVSSEAPKVESKAPVSSKETAPSKMVVSSQPPQAVESKAEGKPIADDMLDFGELMDEAVVDAIIAEGIEYANSKGMTWKDDYTVDGNGYYNPAFSGDGAEIFKRDLFYSNLTFYSPLNIL